MLTAGQRSSTTDAVRGFYARIWNEFVISFELRRENTKCPSRAVEKTGSQTRFFPRPLDFCGAGLQPGLAPSRAQTFWIGNVDAETFANLVSDLFLLLAEPDR